MKSILDNLKSGNFASIKNTLSNAMQGNNQQASGDAPSVTNNISSGLGNMGGLGGLLGAGALGGLLGTLISGGSAKKIAKGALVMGGSAAAGAMAWNFYKKWAQPSNQEGNAQSKPSTNQPAQASQGQAVPAQEQVPPVDNDTSMILLEAMVFAARADGHIDENEKQNINNVVTQIFPNQDTHQLIDSLIHKPIDPNSLAARIKSPEEAYDVYRLSCMILEIDHFMERSYLDGLAAALNISNLKKQELEKEVINVKSQLTQA